MVIHHWNNNHYTGCTQFSLSANKEVTETCYYQTRPSLLRRKK